MNFTTRILSFGIFKFLVPVMGLFFFCLWQEFFFCHYGYWRFSLLSSDVMVPFAPFVLFSALVGGAAGIWSLAHISRYYPYILFVGSLLATLAWRTWFYTLDWSFLLLNTGVFTLVGFSLPALLQPALLLCPPVMRGRILGAVWCGGLALGSLNSLALSPTDVDDLVWSYGLSSMILFVLGLLATISAWLYRYNTAIHLPASTESVGLTNRVIADVRLLWANHTIRVMIPLTGLIFLFYGLYQRESYLGALDQTGTTMMIRLSVVIVVLPLLGWLIDRIGATQVLLLGGILGLFLPLLSLFEDNLIVYIPLYILKTVGFYSVFLSSLVIFCNCIQNQRSPALVICLPFFLLWGAMCVTWAPWGWDSLEYQFTLLLSCSLYVGIIVLLFLWKHQNTPPATNPVAAVVGLSTSNRAIRDHLQDMGKNYGLSPREVEVFVLICQGLSTANMANRLLISENTVKVHIGRVLRKTGTNSRNHLMSIIMNVPAHDSSDTDIQA